MEFARLRETARLQCLEIESQPRIWTDRVDPVYAGLFDPQKWNRYAYSRNNPLRFLDASGRDPLPSGFCTEFPEDPRCKGSGGTPPGSPDDAGDGCSPAKKIDAAGARGCDDSDDGDGGGGDGQDPSTPQCDPVTGAGCTPSIIIAVVDGFIEGVGNSFAALWPGSEGPESCLLLFGRETISAFVPIAPSLASLAEPAALFAGQRETNRALDYAASRPNVTGGKGLLFPFKSSNFRDLFSRGQQIATRGASLLTLVVGEGQALSAEWKAAREGRCQ